MTLALRISTTNRRRKWELFLRHFPPAPDMRVLDVGFCGQEYSPADNWIEKHYPYPHQLTAVGLEGLEEFSRRYPRVRAVQYDGGRLPFDDGQFDVAWSNAVLEHVGAAARQVEFLRELRRVARRACLSTPNRWFPIEIHTRLPLLHWLPKGACDAILRGVGKHWATGDYMHLLSRRRLQKLLEQAGFDTYQIVANRLAGLVLDFVVITNPPRASET